MADAAPGPRAIDGGGIEPVLWQRLEPRVVEERVVAGEQVMACLRRHESEHGANESTYWIWFELLWRDYFKFWCARHGARVFTARALGKEVPAFDAQALERWRSGTTGQSFVDAGMRELATSGFLSNRMRQVVASYLVNDLGGDWRAGADWFESCLVDFDVTSNQGNWAYLAGRGADPRGVQLRPAGDPPARRPAPRRSWRRRAD